MKNISTHFLCAACILLCHSYLQAQTVRPQTNKTLVGKPENKKAQKTTTKSVTPAQVEGADLAITANVSARELRFKQVGKVKVQFSGTPQRDTVWEEQRQNIAKPAQPNVTYRDIGSHLRIISRFANIDQLLNPGSVSTASQDSSLGQQPYPASTATSLLVPIPAPVAPLLPLPVSAASIPQPKAVLPPKPVLPVKPLPSNNSQGR